MKRVGEEISATDRCATQADMGNSAFSAKALAPPTFPPPPSCCVCVCRFFAPTCARDSFFFFFHFPTPFISTFCWSKCPRKTISQLGEPQIKANGRWEEKKLTLR